MDTLRIGVIGVGWPGQRHIEGYQKHPNAQIVALSDVNTAAAERVKAEYNVHGAQIFGDYGDTSEIRAGASWYFVRERGLRLNGEWIHLNRSPVGYTAVPYPVGGNGNVFNVNLEMNF